MSLLRVKLLKLMSNMSNMSNQFIELLILRNTYSLKILRIIIKCLSIVFVKIYNNTINECIKALLL